MDLAAIEAKLEQIEILLSEVVQALPTPNNTSEPIKAITENPNLIPVKLFEGFDVHNPVHAVYLLLCHRASESPIKTEIVKQYLMQSGQSFDRASVDTLRKSLDYLVNSRNLPRPWRKA
jgi:hypothetical protein